MASHRFKAGQTVFLSPSAFDLRGPRGIFEIVRPLPADGDDNQYRVKSTVDGHERVVRESQLDQNERLQAIEALAQSLYEASDDSGTPWARRGKTIRDAWIFAATKQLSSPRGD